ncbi:glucan-binding YG repeat protein [Clostridium beijerinckii]|uniref:N-acetylmuramoyl-L-alanine amidase family protein n=1 Tax=Clostridium beijerinckii TaxID=1520 RepID=UPI0015712CB2|nr:cadherin-like beta sandwich domain-containing protein [Clostridium beijerinckii]NRT33826.1 glucan-binding YG repeat protein [Clostridium beijerinckii]NRT46745.1 glucan-binding YG repeat protein [Clostridium beijerinckii]NRZ19251.1 glucan-binding YG repeat protein [Clostridium beijerinckii]
MNRNIKRIVALTIAATAFSAIVPATSLTLTTTAYASTGDLSSIKLKTSSGSTIKTYSNDDYKSKNEVDDDELKNNETYYAKTSSSKIKISVNGADSSNVRIFKGRTSSTKGVKTGSTVELSKGSTTVLTIRTYSTDPGMVKYSDNSYSSQYTIRVKCTASSSSDDEDDNKDVYLKSISLSEGDLSFSKNTSDYSVNVSGSVDESDKFRKTVSLNKGKNDIKITVKNDGDKRTYTLNIYRGGSGNNSNSSDTPLPTKNIKTNQWVQVNGRWQYNDSTGNPVKNNWIRNYYLQSDGNMATGWLNYGGTWYYLGGDGAKKAGWQLVNGNWYYMDSEGRMQTGWIKDVSGKYYYLYSNGAMACNTTIGGYRLGFNGAWIK